MRRRRALGFDGRPVILTFGLLSPSKGIEVMIDAMPEVLESSPAAVYVVLGATHPNLIRDQGETYRSGLMARVRALGIEDHVVFLDRFVDQATLLRFISMCDVYATPYLNEAQLTSGTLAYSFGLGKAVISTPYWHARELLGDGRGVLVPFGDVAALGRETAGLLHDEPRRFAMRERAYAESRPMTWPRIAERYRTLFESMARGGHLRLAPRHGEDTSGAQRGHEAARITPIGHFLSLCDDTGLLQHAVHSVANRSHGYCTDDNARALLLACALGRAGEPPLPETATCRFAAFLQHAWNPDTRRFRNFMSFDRRWHSDPGSEDSHGRALWALGECARSDHDHSRRRWAASLFAEALPSVESFLSPRAWSFTLLGLDGYCAAVAEHVGARRLRELLANRLLAIMAAVATPDWEWFENGLAYDNARLPQALIVTGCSIGTPRHVAAGLRSLQLAHEPADGAGRLLQARRAPAASAPSAPIPSPSISNPWKPPLRSRRVSPRGVPTVMTAGGLTRNGRRHGSSAVTICHCRWSTSRPAVAATACIRIAPTRTAAANPQCPISSVSPTCINSARGGARLCHASFRRPPASDGLT